MAKICPESGEKVIYLTCLECESQACRTNERRRVIMEEIKNLMETIQKENKNAIVVWSEDTANGLSVSIQMNGKTESFMTMALHVICSIATTWM